MPLKSQFVSHFYGATLVRKMNVPCIPEKPLIYSTISAKQRIQYTYVRITGFSVQCRRTIHSHNILTCPHAAHQLCHTLLWDGWPSILQQVFDIKSPFVGVLTSLEQQQAQQVFVLSLRSQILEVVSSKPLYIKVSVVIFKKKRVQ